MEDFLKAVKAGIQCWELAGQILVKLKAQDSGIFKKIMMHAKWMTAEILTSFYRIGEGKLYPQVMLLRQCPAESALLMAEYDVQRQLCNEPVKVCLEIQKDGTPRLETRWIQELGKEEAALVFKGRVLRPINEQIDILRERKMWQEHQRKKTWQAPAEKSPAEKAPSGMNSIGAAMAKKIHSLGVYSVKWEGSEPILVRIGAKPLATQQVLLKEDGLKQLGGIIEFTQWK